MQLFRKFVAVLLGHAHVDTLAEPTIGPIEERVGEGQVDPKVNAATGTVVTSTGNDSTMIKVPTVTWADIVKKPVAQNVVRMTQDVNATRGPGTLKRCGSVSRSFYRNNPVNKTNKV